MKSVDGFFIDNCDVYYYAPRESIFEGLTAILLNIWKRAKQMEWKYICWNIQRTQN